MQKLLLTANRAMAITELTHLRISIPASGASPGKVPAHCFPGGVASAVPPQPRRVSFAPNVLAPMEDVRLTLPELEVLPDDGGVPVTIAEPSRATLFESPEKVISPPPGFPLFSWPEADWIREGDSAIDP